MTSFFNLTNRVNLETLLAIQGCSVKFPERKEVPIYFTNNPDFYWDEERASWFMSTGFGEEVKTVVKLTIKSQTFYLDKEDVSCAVALKDEINDTFAGVEIADDVRYPESPAGITIDYILSKKESHLLCLCRIDQSYAKEVVRADKVKPWISLINGYKDACVVHFHSGEYLIVLSQFLRIDVSTGCMFFNCGKDQENKALLFLKTLQPGFTLTTPLKTVPEFKAYESWPSGISAKKQFKKLYRHSHFGAFPEFNPEFELYRYTLTDPSIEFTKLSTVLGLENISVILKAPRTPELNAKKIARMVINKDHVCMTLENERVFPLEKDCLFWNTLTETWFLISETYKKVEVVLQCTFGKEKFDMGYTVMVDEFLTQGHPVKMPHSNIVRSGLDLRDILDSQLQVVIGAVKPTPGNTVVAVKEAPPGTHLLIFNSVKTFPISSCELGQDTDNGNLLLDCGSDDRVPVSIYLNGTPVNRHEVETLIQDAKWARTSAPSNHEQRRRSWGSNAFLTERHKGETMETPAPQITRSEESVTLTTTGVRLSEALTLAGLKVTYTGMSEEEIISSEAASVRGNQNARILNLRSGNFDLAKNDAIYTGPDGDKAMVGWVRLVNLPPVSVTFSYNGRPISIKELQRLLKELKNMSNQPTKTANDDVVSMHTMESVKIKPIKNLSAFCPEEPGGLETLIDAAMGKLFQMVDGGAPIRVTNQFNKREDQLHFDKVSKVTSVVKNKDGVTTHTELIVIIPEALGKNTHRVVWVVTGVDFVNKCLVLRQDITKETIFAHWD